MLTSPLTQIPESSKSPENSSIGLSPDMSLNNLNELFWSDKIPRNGQKNSPEKLAYRKHVCSIFGDMKIKDFESVHGLKIRNNMQKQSYNPATINHIISTGRQEFNIAQENGILSSNPWNDVAFLPHMASALTPSTNSNNTELIAPDDLKILNDQFRVMDLGNYMKLLLSSDTKDISPAILLSACSSALNEETNTFIFHSTLPETNSSETNDYPEVQISLSSKSMILFKDELQKRAQKKAQCSPEKWSDSPDYLFCTWNGGPITRAILNSYVRVIQQNTGFSWFSIQRLHSHARYVGMIETYKRIYDELSLAENESDI